MNGTILRISVVLAAIVAIAAAAGPATAGAVCADGLEGQCQEHADAPQPNSGDVAPGMLDGGAAIMPDVSPMAPAAAAAPPPPPVATPPAPDPSEQPAVDEDATDKPQ